MVDKILIVDDDVDSLKLIGMMLQKHGYEVIAANAGQQALTRAVAEQPSLIILDVMMPDMNGYEVCRRLRSNPQTKPIPIIMFTAKTMIDDKVAGFEAGADDYLTKPTHPAELASRVRYVLGRSAPPPQPTPNKGHVIGILGARGGVGCTTLALNLAAALFQEEKSVITADYRLGSGSLGAYLGFSQAAGMANLLSRPVGEIKPSTVDKELVAHSTGLKFLLSSISPREAQINHTPESAVAILQSLQILARLTVLDLGSQYNRVTARLCREVNELLLIVDPDPVTLKLGQNLLQIFKDLPTETSVHVVVVNRAKTAVQPSWHEAEHLLGKDIWAILSSASELAYHAADANMPMVLLQPNAIASTQISKLADNLLARLNVTAE